VHAQLAKFKNYAHLKNTQRNVLKSTSQKENKEKFKPLHCKIAQGKNQFAHRAQDLKNFLKKTTPK